MFVRKPFDYGVKISEEADALLLPIPPATNTLSSESKIAIYSALGSAVSPAEAHELDSGSYISAEVFFPLPPTNNIYGYFYY